MVEFVCWTHLFWQLLSLVLVGNHYRSQLLLKRSKVTNPMPTQYWHEPLGDRTGRSSSGDALAFKQCTFGGGHTAEAIPEVALHCGCGGSEAGRAKSRNLAQGGAQVALSLIDFNHVLIMCLSWFFIMFRFWFAVIPGPIPWRRFPIPTLAEVKYPIEMSPIPPPSCTVTGHWEFTRNAEAFQGSLAWARQKALCGKWRALENMLIT